MIILLAVVGITTRSRLVNFRYHVRCIKARIGVETKILFSVLDKFTGLRIIQILETGQGGERSQTAIKIPQ